LLGDDDQIVPTANLALLSAEVGKNIGPAGSSRAHLAGWLKSCATKSTPIFSPPIRHIILEITMANSMLKVLTPQNCKVIFIDHQPQMAFGVQSIDRQTLKHNTVALAKAAKVFKISSAECGRLRPPVPRRLQRSHSVEIVHVVRCRKTRRRSKRRPNLAGACRLAAVRARQFAAVREYRFGCPPRARGCLGGAALVIDSPPLHDDQLPPAEEGNDGSKSRGFLRQHPFASVIGLALSIAVAGRGYLYWEYSEHFQYTDDAFIASRQIAIAPKVSGYITQVPVTDNQHVAQGDVIARIDDRDFRVALEQANAQGKHALRQGRAARAGQNRHR
jgi:Biotin-lipoyl like